MGTFEILYGGTFEDPPLGSDVLAESLRLQTTVLTLPLNLHGPAVIKLTTTTPGKQVLTDCTDVTVLSTAEAEREDRDESRRNAGKGFALAVVFLLGMYVFGAFSSICGKCGGGEENSENGESRGGCGESMVRAALEGRVMAARGERALRVGSGDVECTVGGFTSEVDGRGLDRIGEEVEGDEKEGEKWEGGWEGKGGRGLTVV